MRLRGAFLLGGTQLIALAPPPEMRRESAIENPVETNDREKNANAPNQSRR
jgi:hypothetical protein